MHQHDHKRMERIGMPEAVLCSTKTDAQLQAVLSDLVRQREPVLLTRLSAQRYQDMLADGSAEVDYDPLSETGFLHGTLAPRSAKITVVAAGTSDHGVAAEATRTLQFSGVAADLIVDVGVAGLWRLEARLEEIREADIVIAVAGMDAALVSVLGGLLAAPVIAVPTSVGYGVAAGGQTALHSALASCAQGVTVVNIDNGFGAATAAVRMLSLMTPGQ